MPLFVELNVDSDCATLCRLPGGDLTLKVPAGRQASLRRLTEAQIAAETALREQCQEFDYL